MGRNNTRPNESGTSVRVHKIGSLGSAKKDPLILLSNIRCSFSRVSPSAVRSVSILGSMSTTVCNVGTTGNIVLIASGGKDGNGPHVRCGKGTKVRHTACLPSIIASPVLCVHLHGLLSLVRVSRPAERDPV